MIWIKVEEKLPENDVDVLIFNPKDGISIGEFDADEVSGYWEDDKSYCVTNSGWHTQYDWAPYMSPTHWMPLPEVPNDKEEDYKIALGNHDFPISNISTLFKEIEY